LDKDIDYFTTLARLPKRTRKKGGVELKYRL
jgi:hypothetical protein